MPDERYAPAGFDRAAISFPAIDREGLPGNPRGMVRGEKHNTASNIFRGAESLERDSIYQRLLSLCTTSLPLAFGVGVGPHETGRDAVDGNVPRAQLMSELARQADHGGFGGGIGLDAGQAYRESGTAGNIHDAPEARGLHAWRDRLTQVERTTDVDGENRVPFLQCDGFQRLADLTQYTSGVVHENVDSTAGTVDLVH